MGATPSSNSQTPIEPVLRSYHFRAATILVGIDVVGAIVLILRRLNNLPFGALATLIAGIMILITLWRLAFRQYQRIALALSATGSHGSFALLSACGEYIERGLLLVGVMVLMFLTALESFLR